jgi:hypothetical protein
MVSLFDSFCAGGGVVFVGATIGGDLVCRCAQFSSNVEKQSPDLVLLGGQKPAISARSAKIQGIVFLQGLRVEGGVDLGGATIGGNLECDGSEFVGKGQAALNANSAKIQGNVYLRRGFKAEGEVDLIAATIGGSLACENGAKFVGEFIKGKEERLAISAGAAKVDGSVLFRATNETERGLQVDGIVSFTNAHVGSNFQWKDIESRERASLDLRFTKVGLLLNEQKSWPSKGNLKLEGFVYDQFDDRAPIARVRLSWLHLQPEKPFSSQPYEQLAKVLKSSGYESEATEVLIAKQDDLRRYGDLGWPAKLWNRLLGLSIGHGYKPDRAFLLMIYFVLLGAGVFRDGYRNHLFTRNSVVKNKLEAKENYTQFQPFIYSLDCFLPFIDLKQKNAWSPNASKGYEIVIQYTGLRVRWGDVLRFYLCVHTLFGWALTTLWVAGFTGLVRRLN